MEESMLELYFDNVIANDSSRKKEEEEVSKEPSSYLPDELINQDGSAETQQTDTGSSSSSSGLNYSSQNPTAAAEVPAECPQPEPDTSVVHLLTPVTPERPETILQIQNILSTVKLGCQLDLNVIARKAWNVKYDPKTYQALVMTLRKPRTTALMYISGKMVCLGAKSEEESRVAARRFAYIIQKLGFPARFLDFKIHNVVASCKMFPVNLAQVVEAHPHQCSYEPELFPALFYNDIPGIKVAVFSSGTMNFSGAKKQAENYKALDIISPILHCFRR